jgi:hypothetical protein
VIGWLLGIATSVVSAHHHTKRKILFTAIRESAAIRMAGSYAGATAVATPA